MSDAAAGGPRLHKVEEFLELATACTAMVILLLPLVACAFLQTTLRGMALGTMRRVLVGVIVLPSVPSGCTKVRLLL